TNIYEKAAAFKEANTRTVESYDEFKRVLEADGGFIYAHWDGTTETEEKIKEETKATIRCIPLNSNQEEGTCIYSGKPSKGKVLFAKAY
ncbi:MAG: proline--tRNA ligase, partial [Marinoscillum sp.]